MVVTIATLLMALTSLVLTSYSRKMDEKEKSNYLVWGNVACLAGIVILNAANQVSSSADDKEYKKAAFELKVLTQVNEFAIPVFENYAAIINNFNPIKNYIYQEQAKAKNLDAVHLIEAQQERIRAQQSFQDAIQALGELKSIALKIQILHTQYENTIPQRVVEWSRIVNKIELEKMDLYFDPYAREDGSHTKSVMNFFELSGNAFGISIGRTRQASETINSLLK